MRTTGLWQTLLVSALVAGSAVATPTGFSSADGSWGDWFTYGGDVNNADWDQANAASNLMDSAIRWANAPLASHDGGAGTTDGDGTNPAYGGQDYDVEQIFYYFEDLIPGHDSPANTTGGILHVGLVTGFPPDGTADFLAGDLFVGFGGASGFTVAVGVSTNGVDAARYGQLFDATNPGDYDPVAYPAHSIAAPYRSSGANVTAAPDFTGVAVAWGGLGKHNFLEVAIGINGDVETQITDMTGGLSLHWTMGCGNDYIDVQDTTPFAPVPEPSTLVLLGMGVVGVVLRTRRPRC